MASTIKLKNGSGAPTSGQLVQGEPALDLTNKRLYTENASGTVIEVGTNPSSLTTASADINGGTIDGTVIGGSSAAAGSFTTISASGEIAANGGIALGDNDKATFGASNDLQIFHDGSNSYITEFGTGNLNIRGQANINFESSNGSETFATFALNGASTLYYDNAQKLATTSTGIDVTGTVTADGLTVDGDATIGGSSGGKLGIAGQGINAFATTTEPSIYRTGSGGSDIFSAAGHLVIQPRTNAARSVNIATSSDGVSTLKRASFADNGDISFYEDTGTTAKFFWDASAESLTITGNDNAWTINNATLYGNRAGQVYIGASNASGQLAIVSGGTESMRIDSSGNVGIGTTSPAFYQGSGLEIERAGIATVRLQNTTTGKSAELKIDTDVTLETINTGSSLLFNTAATERMRIDSSGNLLVGTTDTDPSNNGAGGDTGHAFSPTGYISSARSNAAVGIFNRMDSDGEIAVFRKDGTNVGSIGADGGDLFIGTGDTGIRFSDSGNAIVAQNPSTVADSDAFVDLGTSGIRFKDLYLSGGAYLGGTGAANHLDDYEEGTWTVTLYDALTGGNASSTTTTGYYTKVGNQVTVIFNGLNNISTTGMTAGNQLLISLPFSAALASSVGSIATDNITFAADGFSYMTSDVAVAASRASIHRVKDGSDGYLTVADVVDGVGDIGRFTLTYFTA